ncbi:MAG TPA: cytochrome D ubiquinol oxidase subunit I [Hyphomonas atlantica]|uniref:Cytochrome D ubiquinol oxidase subunit I n=1 Tax=Hyphomonas atlantica TaxID=1280948 RepID=A0A356W935_9PROT|nr:pyridoxal-dependent decarboxylase [Hyphomonas atlantica]HAE94504.1 cytochrome D ubiquinol oxidase subunit I [Hyphomonas atlantica]HBQ50191.1 cytochrome D ubiquinol oxidase subunit I [Hyphomonas atlantica]
MANPDIPNVPDTESLDPEDWEDFRMRLHRMIDIAVDQMERSHEGRVWTPFPDEIKSLFDLSQTGQSSEQVDTTLQKLLPYGVGNTHPRFFGWVHGSGTPSNLVAEIAAATMNANTGGRNHAAIEVERLVIEWCKGLFSFPDEASGLVMSGTSMATIVAIKAARDARLDFKSRQEGLGGHKLVGYTSTEAHACIARAFDMVGLGTDALRRIPVTADHQIDIELLKKQIHNDREGGFEPFLIAGTCGSVNAGTIDDLMALSDISETEQLWFHIDGAFGALGMLSDRLRHRLAGLERADSIAFDFHKWLHVNYDAGCILIRSGDTHLKSFSDRPDYLKSAEHGLAAGGTWPVELGPELSRGFRALKVWAQIAEHGEEKLGRMISRNCEQAAYLGELVEAASDLELLLPVSMQICCFRYVPASASDVDLNSLNEDIVIQLQMSGIAAPSTTRIDGKTAIRVNITNHRTAQSDLDVLVGEVRRIGADLTQSH